MSTEHPRDHERPDSPDTFADPADDVDADSLELDADATSATRPSGVAETDEDATPEAEHSEDGDPAPATGHRTPPRFRRRTRLLVGAAAAALVLGGAGAAVASAHKSVEVQVDGETRTVSTFAGSVAGLLEQEGLEVGEHDLLVPGPDEPLTSSTDVVLRTAQQVSMVVDGQQVEVWTVGDTVGDALADLGRGDVTLVASRDSDRAALDLPVVADGPVDVAADGEQRRLEIGGVADLATVLLRAEITLAPADRVEVTASDDEVPLVTVTRIETREGTRTEALDFDTVERGTDELYEGQSRVVAEGAEGERTDTVVERLVDGEVSSSKLIGSEITTEPQDRVVERGTAVRPPPPPPPAAPAPSQGSGDSGSGSSGGDSGGSSGDGAPDDGPADDGGSDDGGSGGQVGGDVWAALAQCESGGNPRAVSASGTYHGLYQFSVSTWQSVGGSGLASQASPAEQTQRAQALQARSGWGQWPHCSAQLGLR